ncbi:MAG TPA: C45 family peptidase [Longimicrobiales bacterium]|nr:C45 family peptidase [Longimicrobiales bacterium]
MDHVVLYALNEPDPGPKWKALWTRLEPGYRRWFLREGDAARPSYLTCRRALEKHMPELVPVWEALVEQAGGGDTAARLLSLYRPTPYLTGCSQAVWNRTCPMLIRNYDYGPQAWDAVMLRSVWTGRRVIAMTDVLWGALDGINESGLSVALAFGGRKVVGDGFGIPLIVRYLLETCETSRQAAAALRRLPSHMTYNVTAVDATGSYFTAHVAPDRPTTITARRIATNHQNIVEWHEHAHATGSVDRERFLVGRLADEDEEAERFVQRFLEPPLFSTRFDHGWGTLYTAVYRSADRIAEYRWPGTVLAQSIDRFREVSVRLTYGQPPRTSRVSA